MDRLHLTEDHLGAARVLVLRGELDIATAPLLCERMSARRRHGHAPATVLDLSGLEFCDSTGLRALLGEVREAEICGAPVRVIVPDDGVVRRLFELCCVDHLVAISPRPEASAPPPGRPATPAAAR